MDIVRLGIPIARANRIFTVRGTFQDVAKTSPSHLLLPYCSKAVDCNFRNKNDCETLWKMRHRRGIQDGEKKRNLEVSTIISFEDLMQTLDRLSTREALFLYRVLLRGFLQKAYRRI